MADLRNGGPPEWRTQIAHTTPLAYVFSNVGVLDFVEVDPHSLQNVQYFIRSYIVFWISPQLDVLCTSAVKRYCAKGINILRPLIHIPVCESFLKQEMR